MFRESDPPSSDRPPRAGACETRNNGDAVVRYDQHEAVLVEATTIDPEDDCTIWYVGDDIKKGAASCSTRIGAFQLPGCGS